MTQPKSCGGLGFRDLELFNIALLSGQAWRILVSPEALSSRLLNAIYFPNSSIVNAELGFHPSQIWIAVLEGRGALTHGIIHRVGNGATTKVWDHNWIPWDSSLRPFVSLAPNPHILVSELADNTSSCWRMNILEKFFLSADVQATKNIPLCTSNVDDFLTWNFERNEAFSIWSSYRFWL